MHLGPLNNRIKCEYCGGLNDSDTLKCCHCGASIKVTVGSVYTEPITYSGIVGTMIEFWEWLKDATCAILGMPIYG